ncbi:hypothetical protein [Endozoicomonas lisbonensis]|uniref:Uncharacterized protein n=1 Tax=Endozoicomonas lisbonensis TaxID=3120522 RepID=A0ABV2SN15_9GAMM
MSGEVQLPVLLFNKTDFNSTISIHNKRWQCIDITPVTHMPSGLLVVRMTYCNNFNFKIYAYKSYSLNGNVRRYEVGAINGLAEYEFYRLTSQVATRCPVNYVMSYQALLEDEGMKDFLKLSEQTEHYYKLRHINKGVTIFLPKIAIDTVMRTGKTDGKDISTLGGLVSSKQGLHQLDAMLMEYNTAYAEWKNGLSM